MTALQDKIKGGWAGKIIGVSYGEPTEFRARGRIYDGELFWTPDRVQNALFQDDLYVQMSFLSVIEQHGLDAPVEKFAEAMSIANYNLWCANAAARKNFFENVMPPLSGHPDYNLWADAIDFQIDADFIGFMCPAMNRTLGAYCDKIGRIISYGDGLYGGIFIAAMYSFAFYNDRVSDIIDYALHTIPEQSQYAQCIRDAIELHMLYPEDWTLAWAELDRKWGNCDMSLAFDSYNIDAKLNGAFVVLGLLYGENDFAKTMEISIRCGQDSDCNPATAAAVLGVKNGYEAIPDIWKSGIPEMADKNFSGTTMTLNRAIELTQKNTLEWTRRNNGIITDTLVTINFEFPLAPPLEVSFPDVVPALQENAMDGPHWTRTGDWKILYEKSSARADPKPVGVYSSQVGAFLEFQFEGTGIVIRGNWARDGGKANIYLDSLFIKQVETYYWWGKDEKKDYDLWHYFNLDPGVHTLKIEVAENPDNPDHDTIYVKTAEVFRHRE